MAKTVIPRLWNSTKMPESSDWFCRIAQVEEMEELVHINRETKLSQSGGQARRPVDIAVERLPMITWISAAAGHPDE